MLMSDHPRTWWGWPLMRLLLRVDIGCGTLDCNMGPDGIAAFRSVSLVFVLRVLPHRDSPAMTFAPDCAAAGVLFAGDSCFQVVPGIRGPGRRHSNSLMRECHVCFCLWSALEVTRPM